MSSKNDDEMVLKKSINTTLARRGRCFMCACNPKMNKEITKCDKCNRFICKLHCEKSVYVICTFSVRDN